MKKFVIFNFVAAFMMMASTTWATDASVTNMDNGWWQVTVQEGAEQVTAQFPAKPEAMFQDPNFDEFTGFELVVQNDRSEAEEGQQQEYRLLVSRDLDVLSLDSHQNVAQAIQQLLPKEVSNDQIAIRVEEEVNEQTDDRYVWQGTVTKEYAQNGEWKLLDTLQLRFIVSDKLLTIATFAAKDSASEEPGASFLNHVQHQVR